MQYLALVLGDQLSCDLALLRDLDLRQHAVLLAEVWDAAGHVPCQPKKVAPVFSVMQPLPRPCVGASRQQ